MSSFSFCWVKPLVLIGFNPKFRNPPCRCYCNIHIPIRKGNNAVHPLPQNPVKETTQNVGSGLESSDIRNQISANMQCSCNVPEFLQESHNTTVRVSTSRRSSEISPITIAAASEISAESTGRQVLVESQFVLEMKVTSTWRHQLLTMP